MPRIHFRDLSNEELIENTKNLVRSATSIEVKILYHLDEIRCRYLEACMGHGGLIPFAIEVLGMTPDQAAKRSAALTNCRHWPELMLLLEQGKISLTSINLVGPKLTEANKSILLNEIIGKSTREVRQLLAEVDASGERRPIPALIYVRLLLPAAVLERWYKAKALTCGAKMATLEDALTIIVDDYLTRHDPQAKAQRAAERMAKIAKEQARAAQPPCETKRDAADRLAPPTTIDCRTMEQLKTTHSDHERTEEYDLTAITQCHVAGVDELSPAMHYRAAGNNESTWDIHCRAANDDELSRAIQCHADDADDDQPSYANQCRAADQEASMLPNAKATGDRSKVNKLSRYVPQSVRHALWLRSGGRCEAEGCHATQHLQIDHKQAFSQQGRHVLDNLWLLCPTCHKRKTLHDFGYEWQRHELRERLEAFDWINYHWGDCIPPARKQQEPPGHPSESLRPQPGFEVSF